MSNLAEAAALLREVGGGIFAVCVTAAGFNLQCLYNERRYQMLAGQLGFAPNAKRCHKKDGAKYITLQRGCAEVTFVKQSGGDDSGVAVNSIPPVAELAKALGSRIFNVRVYAKEVHILCEYSGTLYRQLTGALGFTATYLNFNDNSVFLNFGKGSTEVTLVAHATVENE
ncbi:MAG: hypothetical protein LBF67_03065 [Prevotellaceae bacterium]|nr:hypothetical protein [Prevotellaceae bacterium]